MKSEMSLLLKTQTLRKIEKSLLFRTRTLTKRLKCDFCLEHPTLIYARPLCACRRLFTPVKAHVCQQEEVFSLSLSVP